MSNIPFSSIFQTSSATSYCAHHHLEDLFARHGRFRVVVGDSVSSLVWPKGSGVYVVRIKGTCNHNGVLYIGKCGKVKNTESGWSVNDGKFQSRLQRWTPYCFQKVGQWVNHFEYGPNFTKSHKSVELSERYKYRLALSEIQIDCFITSDNEENTSPALIECLLLQNYLAVHHSLPPANQEF